jgi:hypothetical protein
MLHAVVLVAMLHLDSFFSLVVKALGYKPEGRGFEIRWGESLNLPNPSGRTRPWRSLWQMSTGNIKKMFLVRGADNLTAIYEPIV